MIQAVPFKPVFYVFFKQEKTRRQTLIDACALESGRFRIPLLQGFIYHRIENLAVKEFGNGRIPEHKHQLVSACVLSPV